MQVSTFRSNRAANGPGNERPEMLVMPGRGTGEARSLLSADGLQVPMDWSRDGKFLLFVKGSPAEDVEVWVLAERSEPFVVAGARLRRPPKLRRPSLLRQE